MKLTVIVSAMLAGAMFVFGTAPVVADQPDSPGAAPNVRSDWARDHSGGQPEIRGMSMNDHVQSYEGNGSSLGAPNSSNANDSARSNRSRD